MSKTLGMPLHLLPGVGLEPGFRFGDRRALLLDRLGQPSRIVPLAESEAHENEREQLEFDELLLSLRFYVDRLAWIESESPDAEWRGRRVMGLRLPELLELGAAAGLGEAEQIEYTGFLAVSWNEVWLQFFCSYGRVTRFTLGVLIDNATDDYVWPSDHDGGMRPN